MESYLLLISFSVVVQVQGCFERFFVMGHLGYCFWIPRKSRCRWRESSHWRPWRMLFFPFLFKKHAKHGYYFRLSFCSSRFFLPTVPQDLLGDQLLGTAQIHGVGWAAAFNLKRHVLVVVFLARISVVFVLALVVLFCRLRLRGLGVRPQRLAEYPCEFLRGFFCWFCLIRKFAHWTKTRESL